MKITVHCLILGCLLFTGCWWDPVDRPFSYDVGIVDAYVPIYAQEGDAELEIAVLASRQTDSAGKIFAIGEKLFQVEQGKGIHIIDYSDKRNPKKLSFLQIPGCQEVAVKGQHLYTNSFEDLVVLDLSAYPDVQVTAREPGVFPELSTSYPPQWGYYECPDPAKGRVVGWEIKRIENPKCRY